MTTVHRAQPLGEHVDAADVGVIDEYPGEISPRKFWKEYVEKWKPVMLRGVAKKHPAYRLWTPEYLKRKYGNRSIKFERKKEARKQAYIDNGGVVVNASITYDVDGDGDFESDPLVDPGTTDQDYNVLLYIGNLNPEDPAFVDPCVLIDFLPDGFLDAGGHAAVAGRPCRGWFGAVGCRLGSPATPA